MNIRSTTLHRSDLRIRPRRSRAFTLVELVIVLTIIGILAGSSIYLIVGFVDDAKYVTVDGDIKAISLAIGGFARDNYSRPPSQEQGLEALMVKPTGEPQPKMWRQRLKEIPIDPWGTAYQYRYPATKNTTESYDLYSFGEDMVESDDDVGNW